MNKDVTELHGLKIGDWIKSSGKYKNIEREYFADGCKRITRLQSNDLDYTGGGFVFFSQLGKEKGLYFNAVKKS